MEWFTNLLQAHPELAIYLTLGLGFLIGRVQVKGFSLGVVTSTACILTMNPINTKCCTADIHKQKPLKHDTNTSIARDCWLLLHLDGKISF